MKPANWPRYLRAKRLKAGDIAYYWEPHRRDIARGCPIRAEALGPIDLPVHAFPQRSRKETLNDDRCQVVQVHLANFTGIPQGHRLNAAIRNLADEGRHAPGQIHKVLVLLHLPGVELWKV